MISVCLTFVSSRDVGSYVCCSDLGQKSVVIPAAEFLNLFERFGQQACGYCCFVVTLDDHYSLEWHCLSAEAEVVS